jgi:protein-tyrosine phosphatase
MGVESVVCLTGESCPYTPEPLRVLGAYELEDMVHGGPPRRPAREARLVRQAAELVLRELRQGRGVIVHCAGGTGRTGTVIGCVLRALGHDASGVLAYLDRVNRSRGKPGWPESPWQAAMVEAYRE